MRLPSAMLRNSHALKTEFHDFKVSKEFSGMSSGLNDALVCSVVCDSELNLPELFLNGIPRF